MKKITLALFMALSSFVASAQDSYYAVNSFTDTYADLENPTSINNGAVWMYDYYGDFTMPFPFQIMGETVDRFLFDDDNFAFLTPAADYNNSDQGVYMVFGTSLYLQDRTYSTGVSGSPISYKVEGAEGNRILKIEMKNAGLESATDYGYAEDQYYTNFQIWLYEVDNAIEIRFGANNIDNDAADALTEGFGLYVAVGGYEALTILTGDPATPGFGEYNEDTFPFDPLTSYPADGRVYRFDHLELSGVKQLQTNAITLYPNPASSVLTVKSADAMISQYSIFDVTGKVVLQNTVTAAQSTSINVANLSPGVYFVKTDNNTPVKFIKN